MGLTMIILAWAILFVLMALFFQDWLSTQDNPNQSPDSIATDGRIEVTLLPNRQHHYLVNGSINTTPVVFLLDTGATDVVIPLKLAQKIGLQQGSARIASTANGNVRVYQTRLDSVEIGQIKLNSVSASINPGMDNSVVLLGMSALRRVEFAQKGDMLILRQ